MTVGAWSVRGRRTSAERGTNPDVSVGIWRFPEIFGAPVVIVILHFIFGFFLINHPASWGYPHLWGYPDLLEMIWDGLTPTHAELMNASLFDAASLVFVSVYI